MKKFITDVAIVTLLVITASQMSDFEKATCALGVNDSISCKTVLVLSNILNPN